ncbi:MAG: hypothetical protein QXY90_06265 [Candidatus Anstonellales archaeon]
MADDIKQLNSLNLLHSIEKARDSKNGLLSRGDIKKKEKKQKEEDRVKEALENEPQTEDLQDRSPTGKILDIIV